MQEHKIPKFSVLYSVRIGWHIIIRHYKIKDNQLLLKFRFPMQKIIV